MALIPLFLMIAAAALMWLVRGRSMRTQWGLSAAVALAGWMVTIGLRLGPDRIVQLSVWQPLQLFQSPLSLSLDQITWPIIYSIGTVLVAMIFTSASRTPTPSADVKVFWFLYTGAAFLAVLADNLLTIIITWTLFDFISAIFLFSLLQNQQEIRQVITRLSIDFSGVLLILAGAAFNIAAGEGVELGDAISSPLSVILIATGGFVRLGLLPLHFNLPGLMVARRGLGTLLRYYPPAIVLAFLAKVFRAGIPPESLVLFSIAGISGLLIGGIRWVLESDSVAGRPFYILTLSGVGIVATASVPSNFMGIVSAAVVLLLAGAVLSLTEVFTPTHRIYALGAALIHLGIPMFPAGVLLSIASVHLSDLWPGILWTTAILVGISSAALGSLHNYFSRELQWRTGENLARVTYGLGLALPILASIGIGIHFGLEGNMMNWSLAGVQLLLVVGGFILLRNLTEGSVGRLRINLTRLDPSALYTWIGRIIDRVLSGLRLVADLIEGEAAILWIFAIAVFLVLATT